LVIPLNWKKSADHSAIQSVAISGYFLS